MAAVFIIFVIFIVLYAKAMLCVAIANERKRRSKKHRQKDGQDNLEKKDEDPFQAAGEAIQAAGDAVEVLDAAQSCCC